MIQREKFIFPKVITTENRVKTLNSILLLKQFVNFNKKRQD